MKDAISVGLGIISEKIIITIPNLHIFNNLSSVYILCVIFLKVEITTKPYYCCGFIIRENK